MCAPGEFFVKVGNALNVKKASQRNAGSKRQRGHKSEEEEIGEVKAIQVQVVDTAIQSHTHAHPLQQAVRQR